MAKTESNGSWRVIALSLTLAIALLAVIWWLAGNGDESDATRAEGAQPVPSAPSAEAGEELGGAAADPASDTDLTEDPVQEAGTLREAIDAGDTESPGGDLPLMHERLENLNAAAMERAELGAMSLRLYLVVPTVEVLVPVNREAEAPSTLEAQVQRAVEELIGWTGGEMISPLPPETEVREVWVSPAGIAIVDFDATFPDYLTGGSLEEIHAVYGVVATITSSFPEIRAVQILVGGEQVDTLDGHVDVSRPLLPLRDMVLSDRRRR